MAYKHWETWMKFAYLPVLLLSTTVADFTTECQRPCDCRWQSGNKAAICSNSSLKSVPANLSSDIQILDLSNNHLRVLSREEFKKVGLSNLKKLFLKDCYIETVHKMAFTTLAIMIELDLSRNQIRNIHPDTFRGTEKLRLINLSHNFIDKLEDGLFRNLKYLQKVELSNNMIVKIGTKTFVNLPQLKILRIDGNNLSHMKPETLMALNNLSGLDLHNNPWRCDCNLQTFREWVMSHNLYTPPTSCAEPPVITGKLWNELDSSNFACRPTILEPLPDTTLRAYEENVTLVCKVVGNPTPEVVWRFNGRMIEMRTFGEIRYVVSENTMDLIRWVNLTILYARYSDRGNYTCVAENPGGRDEKSLILTLYKYGAIGTIAGLDTDSFAILVGCVIAIVVIFGAASIFFYFTTQKNDSKRLIKTHTSSSNGEALIEGTMSSELDKGNKVEINPVIKPQRKYDAQPSLTSQATEMSELNKTLLDNESALASNEDNSCYLDAHLPNLSQELVERLSQDQTYPPDLLSFPLRNETQISPASGTSSGQDRPRSSQTQKESPVNSPRYTDTGMSPGFYKRFQSPTSQGPGSLSSPRSGYVTLPRRPKSNWFPEHYLQPQILSTINGVIPYQDNFSMRLFGHGNNYYSLNKSELDLGPVSKMSQSFYNDSGELEPAPSPAPGTPHANIPRNSMSSPNIHNQLQALQALSMNSIGPAQGRFVKSSNQRPLKVVLKENENLLKSSSKDYKLDYGVNIVSDTLGRTRTAPKPLPRPRKININELKDPLFLNSSETATQV